MKLIALLLSVAIFASCSKDKKDDDGGGYPKNVTIEYKVTSSSGLNAADLIYLNETGGNSIVDGAALPFSKKFTKQVKNYEMALINVTATSGGTIKVEILVNDKVVKSETLTGNTIVHGSVGYQFL